MNKETIEKELVELLDQSKKQELKQEQLKQAIKDQFWFQALTNQPGNNPGFFICFIPYWYLDAIACQYNN